MSKTLAALAAAVVLTASGCCWPLQGGRHGGRGGHGYDERPGAERPDPPRSGRSRPAPPSWRR